MELPVDVVHEVISHICGRKSSYQVLSSLSLVSRAFVHPAQSRLFADITIHPSPEENIHSAAGGGVPTAAKLKVLLSSSPCLALYVRTFRLLSDKGSQLHCTRTDQEDVATCLSFLQHLNSLSISCFSIDWGNISPTLWEQIVRVLRLPSLELIELAGAPLHVLYAHCVFMKHLSVTDGIHDGPLTHTREVSAIEPRENLEALLISHPNGARPDLFETCFLKHATEWNIHKLKRLHLVGAFVGGVECEQLSKLLQPCAASVIELTIDFSYFDASSSDHSARLTSLSILTQFSQLTIFRVAVCTRDDAYTTSSLLKRLYNILKRMPPETPLREVILVATTSSNSGSKPTLSLVWHDIVCLLCVRFQALRDVTMLIEVASPNERAAQVFLEKERNLFPKFSQAQGIAFTVEAVASASRALSQLPTMSGAKFNLAWSGLEG